MRVTNQAQPTEKTVLSDVPKTAYNTSLLTPNGALQQDAFVVVAVKPTVPRKSPVELEVEAIVRALKENPKLEEITFMGKKYEIGVDDINDAINSELEKAKSRMRIFVVRDPQLNICLLYGEARSEKIENVEGKRLRVIRIRRIETSLNLSPSMQAVNDQWSTVVGIEEHNRMSLEMTRTNQRINRQYKTSEHEQIYREFYRGTAGPNAEILEDLVIQHELGEFSLSQKFGNELFFAAIELANLGVTTLKDLKELSADLSVLQYIVELSKKDKNAAQRAYYAWAVFRGPGGYVNEECASNVLLSAAKMVNGQVRIDWDVLQRNTSSMKSELDDIFQEVVDNIRADVGRPDPSAYQAFKKEVIRLEKGRDPKLTDNKANLLVAKKFVIVAMNRTSVTGEPTVLVFAKDCILYQRRVDDWMRRYLGFTDGTVPFKAPQVLRIDPRDLTPEQLEELKRSLNVR